ncbi:unnamed protein product [Rotaria sordida]|uniref:DDE Tnp4 domain-containing protein n=1 Tax=Rotaria sordida TaxID=392033 RepID=A0A815BKP5_9BILA|nr:unnamed protein product [Rotaria sordida]
MKFTILALFFVLLIHCNSAPIKRAPLCSKATWNSKPLTVIPFDSNPQQQLNDPIDITFDSEGSFIVTDVGTQSLRKFYEDGRVTTLYTNKDVIPISVFVDQFDDDAIYFSDHQDNTVKKLSKDGKIMKIVADHQFLESPMGIYVDRKGNLYVGDMGKNRIVKYLANNQGIQIIGQGEIEAPSGIFVDEDGDGAVYISDTDGNRILKYLSGSTTGGVTVAGGQGEGNGLNQLSGPFQVLVDSTTGMLFISDMINKRIVKWAKGAKQGEVLSGTTSLQWAAGMKFDYAWNLFVVEQKQRPWSEWSRGNGSCIQHTGHDIEQVQLLYSMCEQLLTEYCTNRKRQETKSTNTPYLLPINLLSITLLYLKHYHSLDYIATELNFGKSTIHYFLSSVIDILYSPVYSKLILLFDDMDDETTIHGPEESHKLIVDSTFVAIYQPEDSEQRKMYYHAKSLTNYAFKIQIACDFNYRIVHVSKCYPGSVHDITILRESGLLEHTKEHLQIIADTGYIGEQYVITPKKKSRGGELTAEDKDINRSISSARVAIENINQRIKTYTILRSTYKGTYDDLDKITKISRVVAALCNLKLSKNPIRKSRI